MRKYADYYVERFLEDFKIDAEFARFWFNWEITPDISLRIGEVFLRGSYIETMTDNEESNPGLTENEVDFTQLATFASIRHQFGSRIAVSLLLNNFVQQFDYVYLENQDSSDGSEFSLLAGFAFLF